MWRTVRRYYALFLPIRLSFVALAVLAFGLCVSDQGADILRTLTEDQIGWQKTRVFTYLAISLGLAFTIWYWSRHLLRFRPRAPRDAAARDATEHPVVEEHPRATRWTPRVLGLGVFLVELVGFGLVAHQYAGAQRGVPLKLWVIVGLLVAEAVFYWTFVVLRRRVFALGQADMSTTVRSWNDFDRSTRGALLATMVAEVLLLAWAFVDPVSWWIFGAGGVLVLTIGIWMPIGSVLVALGERFRFPVLGFLVVWALLVSPLTDNHRIRTAPGPVARIEMQEAVKRFGHRVNLPEHAGSAPRVPAIVVAAEGGGIRAAYWTATVLATLQDRLPTFADHCFAISGVSGGSLGAVVFDALLATRREHPDGSPMQEAVRKIFSFDALSGTLAALSQPDLVQRFVPAPWFPDREAALERGWERGWAMAVKDDASLFGQGFLAMMARHPELPQLFLNGTLVENGARIITGPVGLRSALVFRTAIDAFDKLGSDIPLSTAAGMSTRFTYVSPAGRVPGRDGGADFGHVIDGGYFENSGAVTAGEIVQFLEDDPRIRPVVIVIDHRKMLPPPSPDDPPPFCPAPGSCGPPDPGHVERVANEILSPVLGLLHTRDARGVMALGDLLHHMRRGDGDHDLVDFRLIPRDVPLPLGWVLSDGAMEDIDRAVDCEGGNRSAVSVVAGWLGTSPQPARYCPGKTYPVPPPAVSCEREGCAGTGRAAEMGPRH